MTAATISAARRVLVRKYGKRASEAFAADPHVQTGPSGDEVVFFQQKYAGIPFFGGHVAVHLQDGVVLGCYDDDDARKLDCIPSISAPDAVVAALGHFRARTDRTMCQARHRSLRAKVAVPAITASFPLASRPTVLTLPRMKSGLLAHLEFYSGRLVWVVRLPLRTDPFLLLIAANGSDAGSVVLCTPWSSGARCAGTVRGFDGVRAVQDFPVAATRFPAPLVTAASQPLLKDWIDTDQTIGNNVVTHFQNPQTVVRATNNVFSPNLGARDQMLLNAFFFCNYLHDFFLLLGFGEREGNFQLKNTAPIPGGGDRLQVMLFTNRTRNLGKMVARVDGDRAELKLFAAANGEHAALHADVVIHEYAHGVSQRMVGGRGGSGSLSLKQSLALAEAWSDYFAITLRNHHLAQPDYTFAAWGGFVPPLRSAPYDEQYPGHYGLLGTAPHDTAHGAGEIFAVALIRFNELLGEALDDPTRGHCLGWRIVVESFRQCNPANPTLLDGREAVFRAIGVLASKGISNSDAAEAHRAAQTAFARYGMGPGASGPASTDLRPTTPDFTP